MSKSKILHVIPSLSPHKGGPTYAVIQMIKNLNKSGFLCSCATTIGIKSDENKNMNHIYFKRTFDFYSFSFELLFWLFRNLRNYDLVHIHGLFNFVSVCTALVCWTKQIPYIITPHGSINKYGMKTKRILKLISFNFLEIFCLKNAALIHLTSDEERTDFDDLNIKVRAETIPIPVKKLYRADISHQKSDCYSSPYKKILFMGRIHPVKNLEALIHAFSSPKLSTFTLTICGDGNPKYLKKLATLSKRLQIEKRINWLGHVEESSKIMLLNTCDLLVLPSFSESFGITAIEAISAGLPIVLSENVANASTLKSAGLAFVTNTKPDSISKGILYASEMKNSTFVKKAQWYYSRHYDEKIINIKMVNAYERILNNSSKNR